MAKFMKALAVILLIVMLVGSYVVSGTVNPYQRDTVTLIYGILVSIIIFGVLYSIGYALGRLDDIHSIISKGFGIPLHAYEDSLTREMAAEKRAEPESKKQNDGINPWASGR